MSRELIHSVILVCAIALSFLYPKTALAQYDLQISAGLFLLLFFIKRSPVVIRGSRLLESVIFTLVVLFVVNTTGGIHSPFFFLLQFLLFSLALLLEPLISIVITIALIIFFILSLPQGQSFSSLLPLFSLAFLTPFAMFMGQEYIKNQRLKIKNQRSKEDTLLFMSLILKNHIKSILYEIENFMGDHNLHAIKNHARNMLKLIEKFEYNEK